MADGVALRLNRDPSTGGVEYTAQDERLLAALGVMPDGASGLMTREGKRLGPGLECSISGDGLSVVVQPGVCVVNHALAAGGDYQVAIGAARTKALAAKPGTGLNRRDTVVVDVADEDVTQKATTLREANIAVLQGTNTSGTPTAPAAGTMQFEIGQVNFAGTGTPTIQPTNPRYTWAAGGIGVVYSAAERNALSAYNGLVIYRADTHKYEARVNGAWVPLLGTDSGWFTYGIGGSGWSVSVSGANRMRKAGNRARLQVDVNRSGGNLSGDFTNSVILTLDPGDRPNGGTGEVIVAAGTATGGVPVTFAIDPVTGEVQAWGTSGTINTGDRVRCTFEYFLD